MRTRYWVLRGTATTYSYTDTDGEVRTSLPIEDVVMDVVLPSDETFEPPPWVRHGIENRGWRVLSREITESGLVYHGNANWRQVAEALAAALEGDDEEAATKALDDFRIAVAEVELARDTGSTEG